MAEARTDALAKQAVKNWSLEYEMFESDSSMMEERLYTWMAIVENLRVRKIDTRVLGAVGKFVVEGTPYDEVRIEAMTIESKLAH